jgi:hypothetical protein
MNMNEPGWTSVTASCCAQNSAVPVPPVVTTSSVCPAATENPAGRDRRHVALQNVQVGAADRRRVDPHDDVRRILDLRIRRIGP